MLPIMFLPNPSKWTTRISNLIWRVRFGTVNKNYHFPIGHLAFNSILLAFIKHPHFLQVWIFGLNHSQPLQISRRYSTNSSWLLGDPLIKSQGLTSRSFWSSLIKPLYLNSRDMKVWHIYFPYCMFHTLLGVGGLLSLFSASIYTVGKMWYY